MVMSEGYKEILRVSGNYLFASDVIAVGRVLGGLSSKRKERFVLRAGLEGKPYKSLLEIGVMVKRPELAKWRVWFDGISLTREFNPNLSIDTPSEHYASVIFDVTPLIRREPGRTGHKVILLNDGSEPLLLTHVMLLNVSEVEGAGSSLIYYAGELLLRLGDRKTISTGLEEHDVSGFKAVSYSPILPSLIRVEVQGGEEIVHEQNNIVDIIESSLKKISLQLLSIENEGLSPFNRKGWVLIPSLIAYSMKSIEGELVFEDERIIEKNGEIEIDVRVVNRGALKARNSLFVIFSSGMPLKSIRLGDIQPGEIKEIKERVRPYSESRSIVYRVIWRRLGETRFIEGRYRII